MFQQYDGEAIRNFIVMVMDGVGVGELPDALNYNDQGSDTLGNIARTIGALQLPNLELLGLGSIHSISGISQSAAPLASFGKMAELSLGKDSTTGHWELGGLKVEIPFSYFPDGFPASVMSSFLSETGCSGFLGNKAASGTAIIEEFGLEHMRTGFPIIYTSADSVFQIAAHEEIINLKRLYELCEITRHKVLVEPIVIGRVIARPFLGSAGKFSRTTNRHDFSLNPPGDTIFDVLQKNNVKTIGIGKIGDLYAHRGISQELPSVSNTEGFDTLLSAVQAEQAAFIMVNLGDFDVYYGHRNDTAGFATALQTFDSRIPELLSLLDETDALVITADHGNDPTQPSTDHSREFVPVLYYRKSVPGRSLGIRNSFADVSKTAASFFSIDFPVAGTSFENN